MTEELHQLLTDIQNNVTALYTYNVDHGRMLNQLQSIILEIQSGASAAGGCSGCEELQTSIFDQNDRMQQLSNTIQDMQTMFTETVQTEIDRITTTLTDFRTRLITLEENANQQTELYEETRELIQSMPQDPWACSQRGLLGSLLPDTSITSSSFNVTFPPEASRLVSSGTGSSAWCPEEPNLDIEHLQYDLLFVQRVYGTSVRGRSDFEQWIETYRVEYATEQEGDQLVWQQYTDVAGEPEVSIIIRG